MQQKKSISIENFDDKSFKKRLVESQRDEESAFTHYIQNHKNSHSKYYKIDAIEHVRSYLNYRFEEEAVEYHIAEEALQGMLFEQVNIPFPAPKNPKFTFIDLFEGIGGFRLALQNLKGKCVYTSEWDKYSK